MANKDILALPEETNFANVEWIKVVTKDGDSRKFKASTLKTGINTDPTVVPSSVAWRGARVYRTADLPIANNTNTPVTWQAAAINTDGIWSAGAPTRLVVPTGVTKVRLRANFRWAASSSGTRYAFFSKGGANFIGSGMDVRSATTSAGHAAPVQGATVSVTPGEYFEFVVYQDSGGTLNLDGLTRQHFNWFEMEVVEASL